MTALLTAYLIVALIWGLVSFWILSVADERSSLLPNLLVAVLMGLLWPQMIWSVFIKGE